MMSDKPKEEDGKIVQQAFFQALLPSAEVRMGLGAELLVLWKATPEAVFILLRLDLLLEVLPTNHVVNKSPYPSTVTCSV